MLPLSGTPVARWCYDKVALKALNKEIEIDGLAYSPSKILIVERKTRINQDYIEELYKKVERLK